MKVKFPYIVFLATCIFSVTMLTAQSEIKTRAVQFDTGSYSASEKGTLTGDEIIDYTLVALSGQTMKVSLDTDHLSNYFNVLPPDSEAAIFIGSTSGNEWAGILPADGKYRVRVYLMRSAARRNEKANYKISFSITGAAKSTADVKVAGTAFNATGKVPCSVGTQPRGSEQCDFGVIRHGVGEAEVYLTTAGGGENRVVIFKGDKVWSKDATFNLKANRISDNWEISVNDFDYFTIPDAVINGG